MTDAKSDTKSSSSTTGGGGKCIETSKVVVSGKLVNGKQLGAVLGEGAFGKVKLCTDPSATPPVQYAAKIMSRMKLKGKKQYTSGGGGGGGGFPPMMKKMEVKTAYDKVKSEIALMKRLGDHPNIARLHEVMDDPECDELYLLLELADGGQVMKWDGDTRMYRADPTRFAAGTVPTHDGGIPESIARDLFRDMVVGVEYLHSCYVCHRDIKPDNLLLSSAKRSSAVAAPAAAAATATASSSAAAAATTTASNNSSSTPPQWGIKIVDFGVSKDCYLSATATAEARLAAATLTDTQGTDYFQAPETGTGDAYNGYGADVWALGVVLYILLFGRLPWYNDISAAVFDQISTDPVVIPPAASGKTTCDASANVRDLLQQILEKEPTKRLTIAQIKAHAWLNPNTATATAAAATK